MSPQASALFNRCIWAGKRRDPSISLVLVTAARISTSRCAILLIANGCGYPVVRPVPGTRRVCCAGSRRPALCTVLGKMDFALPEPSWSTVNNGPLFPKAHVPPVLTARFRYLP